MRFMAAPASGLETRNQLRKRQEKNEFYFRLRQENFLDWENEARVSTRKEETGGERISHEAAMPVWKSPRRRNFAGDFCAAVVDRLDLCGQFPASASGGQTFSKL